MLNDAPVNGSTTTPIVACSDSSGLRLGLPPKMTGNCALQSMPWLCVTGQRIGSLRPTCDTPNVCAEKSSNNAGARKPVPYEPRTSTDLVGCQRSVNFGLVVPPKSL